MITLTHTISASIIALTATHTSPADTVAITLSLITPTLLDFDHIVMFIKKRDFFGKNGFTGQLHHARSPFHEVFGVVFVSVIYLVLSRFSPLYAQIIFISYLVHLTQDLTIGRFFPFTPIDKTEIQLFKVPLKKKPLFDVVIIISSLILWTLYLKNLI